jgi:hypothetical protein
MHSEKQKDHELDLHILSTSLAVLLKVLSSAAAADPLELFDPFEAEPVPVV